MIWLVLGVALWFAAHTFKRWAPDLRSRIGDGAKGGVALASLAAIALMVVGYRSVETVPLWYLGQGGLIANNLLMVAAMGLVIVGNSKSRLRGHLRHPMLTGALVWAVAHLLVNGDLESVVLFGGLGLWAASAIFMINRSEPAPEPFREGTVQGDIRLAVITLIAVAVIVAIHVFFGLRPYP